MFELYREAKPSDVRIVHTLEDAHALVDFDPQQALEVINIT
jgi:hypothetical protein